MNSCAIFSKFGGLNGWAFTQFFQQLWYKLHIKHSTKKCWKNGKVAHHHRKNDVLKNTRSQRHMDYYGFVKSRVAKRTLPAVRGTRSVAPAWAKRSSKGAFLKTMKIEHGTKNQLFRKVRRWDPLKTVPGNCFEKTWKIYEKTIGKSIVLDGQKPLENIEKQTLFLILGHSKKLWKKDTKGDLKSHGFGFKMATWASQVRLIVLFLTFCCDAKKSSFLDAFPMKQQIEKIDPWSTKGPNKKCQGRRPGCHFWPGGPRGHLARAY